MIVSVTKLIVVDPGLIERFRSRDPKQFPHNQELILHSVQVWENRFNLLAPEEIGDELYAMRPGQYDKFLGYMRGALIEMGI